MSRLGVIEDEFYKAITRHESKNSGEGGSNEPLKGWSINNVRRLYFAVDRVVIEHHITLSKMKSIIQVIPLKSEAELDFGRLTRGEKVEPLSKLLTSGRIMSSVEEIVVCTKGYPQIMLNHDLKALVEDDNLNKRFPRLTSVFLFNGSMDSIKEVLPTKEVGARGTLFDYAQEKGIEVIPVKVLGNVNWVTRTALRPQFYEPDGGKLKTHFDKLKQEFEEEERVKALMTAELNQIKGAIDKYFAQISSASVGVLELIEELNVVFEVAPTISKAEWARFYSEKMVKDILKNFVRANLRSEQTIRMVDFKRLFPILSQVGVNKEGFSRIQEVYDLLFSELLNERNQEYKQDFRKLTVKESVEFLAKFMLGFYSYALSIVYLGYGAYLQRNSLKHIGFYRKKLVLEPISYNRVVSEHMNRYMPNGNQLGEVLSLANENLVTAMTLKEKIEESKKIINALRGYVGIGGMRNV